MGNVKDDFMEHVADRKILCAELRIIMRHWSEPNRHALLPICYSVEEYESFLNFIDIDNKNLGYPPPQAFWNEHGGIIWYADGTWSEREFWEEAEEIDAYYYWVHYTCPEIPLFLNDALVKENKNGK